MCSPRHPAASVAILRQRYATQPIAAGMITKSSEPNVRLRNLRTHSRAQVMTTAKNRAMEVPIIILRDLSSCGTPGGAGLTFNNAGAIIASALWINLSPGVMGGRPSRTDSGMAQMMSYQDQNAWVRAVIDTRNQRVQCHGSWGETQNINRWSIGCAVCPQW